MLIPRVNYLNIIRLGNIFFMIAALGLTIFYASCSNNPASCNKDIFNSHNDNPDWSTASIAVAQIKLPVTSNGNGTARAGHIIMALKIGSNNASNKAIF